MKKNPSTGRKIVLLKTNAKAISARAAALLAAKSQALDLTVTIADPNAIITRLSGLRAGSQSYEINHDR